ncbi:unnamed protein product, partial [Adineta steineri]
SLIRFIIVERELLADVLSRSKAEYYEKTSFVINILKPLIGVHDLIVSKHAERERARRMLNPAFHSINLQSTDSIRLDVQSNTLTFSIIAPTVDDQGEPFPDEQIRDEAVTFVLAGHDTTTCREEVDRILPNGTIPTYEHLSDLQVIEAVLHETIRLYPAAPIYARQCIREHTISNSNGALQIFIPVNTMIVVNTYVLHRCEDYWPNALEFNYKR